MTPARRRTSLLPGACAGVLISMGCQASPIMPTASRPPTTSVAVRTLVRSSEAPLSGVRILVNHQFEGLTNADGTFLVAVDLGTWVRIEASRDEYEPLGAEGEINGPERWTFYLERVTEQPAP